MSKDKEIKDVSAKEATAVSELPKEQVVTKEVKKEIKKEYRRADMQYRGRLFIDEKYKTPGKVLRVVSIKPGKIDYLQSLGYTLRSDIKIGSGSLTENSGLGSVGTFDAGINVSTPSVIMEIDEDLFKQRQLWKAEDNDEQLKAKVAENNGSHKKE